MKMMMQQQRSSSHYIDEEGDDTNLDLFHHNGSVMKMEHEHRMSVDDGGSADGQSCDICGDVSDGLHFGVFTCRACAAFFRRTVALKLDYACRLEGKCQIEKAQRNMCRSCRYKKCLNVGMLTTAVQQARDGIGKRKEPTKQRIDRPITRKKPTEQHQYPSSSTDSPPLGIALQQLNPTAQQSPSLPSPNHGGIWQQPIITHLQQMAITPGSIPQLLSYEPQPTILLSRMQDGYRHFMSIRKATHAMLDEDSVKTIFSKDAVTNFFGTPADLRMSAFDRTKRLCHMEVKISTEIVDDYFQPFNALKTEDKMPLFKNFYSHMTSSDRGYTTFRAFGGLADNDRLIMNDGGYIQMSQLEKYYVGSKEVKRCPIEATRMFRPVFQYILDVVVGHMKHINLTETEYVALLGLMLWNDSITNISSHTRSLILQTKDQILLDLHHHYISVGYPESQISLKVGNLLLLLPKIQTAVMRFKEACQIAEIFNVFEPSQTCKMLTSDD